MGLNVQGLAGIVLIPLIVWLVSPARQCLPRSERVRLVGVTLLIQLAVALALLKMPWTQGLFQAIGHGVEALEKATDTGMQMVFGYLAGGPPPFEVKEPRNLFLLAFRGLPLILVLSALVQLLYHWGVLQRLVSAMATLLRKATGTGGPLGTIAASSMFLGLVEAPLLVRPYIRTMSRQALFAAMVVTMSTIAGTVLALYASILGPIIPGAAGHLLAGSIMNVPGALMLARLMMPETDPNAARLPSQIHLENAPQSSMDAIAQGTLEGVRLLTAVIAMLIVMVALVALANSLLSGLLAPFGWKATLQGLLGYACAPIAWLIGIPSSEAMTAGSLLGQKLVLNELIAYLDLTRIPDSELSARSRVILTYALCSFANLGSLGIQIGALTAMAPERRGEIVELAPRAMLLGFLATLLSAAIIGIVA
jgi:CNT family concentrative nucleoside transporter